MRRLALLLALASCVRAEDPETPAMPAYDRDAILDEMAAIIAEQIRERHTKHEVFHGCIDWHSAVHGHWALFRIARATGRHAEKAEAAAASLDAEKLKVEAALLREKPRFEMPYGRAWFLLLAEEFERWSREKKTSDPARLREMADEVAASLVAHYEAKPPSPDSGEYDNASWALLRMRNWFAHVEDRERLARVETWIDAFAAADPPRAFSAEVLAPEFFSRAGNWLHLVAETRDAKTLGAALARARLADGDLAPVVRLASAAHHQGTNWSRAWCLASLARTSPDSKDRKRFEAAHVEHVLEGMRHHRLNRHDVMAYSHWVPQFIVYALTTSERR